MQQNGRIIYAVKMTLEDLIDACHNDDYRYGIDALESLICGKMVPYGNWLKDIKISLIEVNYKQQLILQVDAYAGDVIEELKGEAD